MPKRLREALELQIAQSKRVHERDINSGRTEASNLLVDLLSISRPLSISSKLLRNRQLNPTVVKSEASLLDLDKGVSD